MSEMETEVWHCRNTPAIVFHSTLPKVICPNCPLNTVHQPMQTMDMPMIYKCLSCGYVDEAAKFKKVGEHSD